MIRYLEGENNKQKMGEGIGQEQVQLEGAGSGARYGKRTLREGGGGREANGTKECRGGQSTRWRMTPQVGEDIN